MKKFLALCLVLFSFVGCSFGEPKDDMAPTSKGEVNFRLDRVLVTDSELNFDVFLERPDLNLKQETDDGSLYKYTSEFPKSLQPRLMYLSELGDNVYDSGSLCDRNSAPHRCYINIADVNGKENIKKLLKVTFDDGAFASKEIEIPVPKFFAKPQILSPVALPAQGSKFNMSFRDVGADSYKVEVRLCEPYGNDGINPCLDGDEYNLVVDKKEGKVKLGFYSGVYNPIAKLKDGTIEIDSSMGLRFEESVSYTVTAVKEGVLPSGLKTYFESSDILSFEKK